MPNNFRIEDFLPMLPWEGPPLPRFIYIPWPWLPPRVPPEAGPVFGYVSPLRSSATTMPTEVRVRAEVSVRNRGDTPGVCVTRLQYRAEEPYRVLATEWEDAKGIGTIRATIQPGQTVTFWDTILLPISAVGARLNLRFIGDPGEIHGQIVIPERGSVPGEPGYGVLAMSVLRYS